MRNANTIHGHKPHRRSKPRHHFERLLSLEPLETRRLLAFSDPQIIIADQDTGLTYASDAPGFRSVMIQETGNVVAAGSFEGSQGDDFTLVRYTFDGQLDTSFGVGGVAQTNFSFGKPTRINDDTLWGAAMDSEGRIVASGSDRSGNLIVARYTANGDLDNSFSGDGFDMPGGLVQLDQSMHTIAIDAENNIYIAGAFGGNQGEVRVIKYEEDGALDPTFGSNGVATHLPLDGLVGGRGAGDAPNNRPLSIVVVERPAHGGKKILLTGAADDATSDPTDRQAFVMRLDDQGELDPTFGGDGIVTTSVRHNGEISNNYGRGITIDSQDRILISGLSKHGINVIRYLPDGTLDDGTLDPDVVGFNPMGEITDMPGVVGVEGSGPREVLHEGEVYTGIVLGRDVAIDDQGRIVVGAKFDQRARLQEPTAPADLDAFVFTRLVVEENGDVVVDSSFAADGNGFVETLVGNGWNELTEITIAPNGDIWASGLACSSSNGCDQYGNGESFDSVLLRFSTPSPGISVSPASIETTEDGDTDQFDVALETEPMAPVSIDVTSGNEAEGVVVGAVAGVLTLSFDSTNWDVPQSVTVQGVDDGITDGDQSYELMVNPSSVGDADYDSLGTSIVEAVNLDNDLPAAVALFVYDIRFESKRGGKDWRAVFEIRADSNGDGQGSSSDARASGVTIDVEFAGMDSSGQTDSSGTYRTGWMRNLPNGTHIANVFDLVLAGFVWNPLALDLEDDSDNDGRPDDSLYI